MRSNPSRTFLLNSLILAPAAASLFAATPALAAYEAHEWGTFTSLVGSNGITQHGMYHEDEVLPDFVHGFGELAADTIAGRGPLTPPPPPPPPRDRPCRGKSCFAVEFFDNNLITQKMETPVIYFYGNQAERVRAHVRFPEGLITETYPAPTHSYPAKSDNPVSTNGEATFNVEILPQLSGDLPVVPAGNIYGHARNVKSNLVRSGSELEKFIFYRGLGRFQPTIEITSVAGELRIQGSSANLPQAAYLVHVDAAGHAQMLDLGNLAARNGITLGTGRLAELQDHRARNHGSPVITGRVATERLVQGLVGSGLFHDEAVAMIDTWEHGYLKVPGLRLLYVLPRPEVDSILPLTLTPAPTSLARAFVARIEVLLDTEEQRILSEVERQGTGFDVPSLGRFGEAMLRRVKEVYLARADAKPAIVAALDTLIARAAAASDVPATL